MDNKKKAERTARVRDMIKILKKIFPQNAMALNYNNDWEMLVAVVLSAQCTDKRVNQVTEKLFAKYPTLKNYVEADQREFEQDIRSTGFYRNKARNILATAKIIYRDYNGVLPKTMHEMITFPGVARKTANILLYRAHGINEGIAVDTHIRRFAIRFNLTDHTDPVRIEKDLIEIVPKKDWFEGTHRLVTYGQEICPARKHDCNDHPLTKLYPPAAHIWPQAR